MDQGRQTETLRRDFGTSLERARAEVLGRFRDVVDDSPVPARRSRGSLSAPLSPLAAEGPSRPPHDDEILPHDRF